MAKLKTLLKRLKYNTKYVIKAKNEIPLNFRIFERRHTKFQQFLLRNCLGATNLDKRIDLNEKIQIFGKFTDIYEISNDIFSNYDFSNKKLKPAFFNIADVKVPYEASRLQYLQQEISGKIEILSAIFSLLITADIPPTSGKLTK